MAALALEDHKESKTGTHVMVRPLKLLDTYECPTNRD